MVSCSHDGYRALESRYDADRGVLVYVWTCEGCGAPLDEALRQDYRPNFDPRGNDPYLAVGDAH